MPIFQPPPPPFTGGAQPYGQTKLTPPSNPPATDNAPLDAVRRGIAVTAANSWYQMQASMATYPVPELAGVGAWTPMPVVSAFIPNLAKMLLTQVVRSWDPLAPQPITARNLNPSITAVPVNEPPYTMTSSITEMASLYNTWPQGWGIPPHVNPTVSWPGHSVDTPPTGRRYQPTWPDPVYPTQQPGDIAAALTVAAVTTLPPYVLPQVMANILATWIFPTQPITARNLNPSITAVPVNEPPYAMNTFISEMAAIVNSWQPAPYAVPQPPGIAATLVAAVVAALPPYLVPQWLAGVVASWNTSPAAPQAAPRSILPGWSVDNPPPTVARQTTWPDPTYPPQPVARAILPGWSVDNPPPRSTVQITWPDPVQPVQPRPGIAAALFVAVVSAMPPYLLPQWLAGIVQSWVPIPPAPPTQQQGAALLGSVTTPSDNPPFSSRYDTMILNVTGQWSGKIANEAVVARTWTNSATVVIPAAVNEPPYGSPITLTSVNIANGYWVKLREDTAVVAQPQTHIASILAPVILNILPGWLVPSQMAQILQSWATPALPPQTLTGAANLPSIITPSDNPPFARQTATTMSVVANAWNAEAERRVIWPKRIISIAVTPFVNLVGRIRGEPQSHPRGTRAEGNRAEPQSGPTGRRIDQ